MPKRPNNVLARVRNLFDDSCMSLVELGQTMGDEGDTARNSTWQFLNFLNKITDPRLGMLQRFTDAVGVPLVKRLEKQRLCRVMSA